MNDVCFHIDQLWIAQSYGLRAENAINDSTYGLRDLQPKLENEITDLQRYAKQGITEVQKKIQELKAQIRGLQEKRDAALCQKEDPVQPPAQPVITDDTSPNEREERMREYHDRVSATDEKNAQIQSKNQKIDTFAEKCDAAIREIETAVSTLQQLELAIRNAQAGTHGAASEKMVDLSSAIHQGPGLRDAADLFNRAFARTFQCAQAISTLEPKQMGRSYSVDQQFRIQNTRTRAIHSSVPGAFVRESRRETKKTPNASPGPEQLLRERDAAAFFARAAEENRIRMPSANLHKLGGKTFLGQMQQLGFHILYQSDGAMIDEHGMIHWERNHD